MSSSVLTRDEKILPTSPDNGNEAITTNPFAGTWLEHLSADMRRDILKSLEADRNPEEDADTIDAPVVSTPQSKTDFGIHTYSPAMQDEIRASLHLDDAIYPTLPSAAEQEQQEKEQLATLRAFLVKAGRSSKAA